MEVFDSARSNSAYCTISGANSETVTRILDGFDSAQFSSKVQSSTGKYYAEFVFTTGGSNCLFGIATESHGNTSRLGFTDHSWGWMANNRLYHNGSYSSLSTSLSAGDIIGIAVNLATGELWFSANGVWQNGGDPGAGTGANYTDADITNATNIALATTLRYVGDVTTLRVVESDFDYSIPAGFSSWESSSIEHSYVATGGMICGGAGGVFAEFGLHSITHVATGGIICGGHAVEFTPDGQGAYFGMSFVDYPYKTINIDRWFDPAFNRNDNLFEAFSTSGWQNGPMTNNTPVAVESWSGTGAVNYAGLEYWQDCLSLFMRVK